MNIKLPFISKTNWNDKQNKIIQKTNRSSGHFVWSIKSGFGIIDRRWCRWIQNIHGLSSIGDNVFEFSMNTSGVVTFKNENVENDVIENIDETFEKRFLIDRMKTI